MSMSNIGHGLFIVVYACNSETAATCMGTVYLLLCTIFIPLHAPQMFPCMLIVQKEPNYASYINS